MCCSGHFVLKVVLKWSKNIRLHPLWTTNRNPTTNFQDNLTDMLVDRDFWPDGVVTKIIRNSPLWTRCIEICSEPKCVQGGLHLMCCLTTHMHFQSLLEDIHIHSLVVHTKSATNSSRMKKTELEREAQTLAPFSPPHSWPIRMWMGGLTVSENCGNGHSPP